MSYLSIYSAAFVSSVPRADRVVSTENIISSNRLIGSEHKYPALVGKSKYSAVLRPQYNVPFGRTSICHTFVRCHTFVL